MKTRFVTVIKCSNPQHVDMLGQQRSDFKNTVKHDTLRSIILRDKS